MMKSKKNAEKTGIILAAGYGSRLQGTIDDVSLKPLTPVNGVPLIFWSIRSLVAAGCSVVVIVLGYESDEIQASIEEEFSDNVSLIFELNDNYDLKNGVSVLAAREHVQDEFILTMADHILGKTLIQKAAHHNPPPNGATLLVDFKINHIFDLEDATKVLSKANKIVDIGKQIETYNCIDTGLFVGTHGLFDALQAVYQENGDVSLSEGVKLLANQGRMTTLDIEDGFWQDVDTPEMLRRAEQMLSDTVHFSNIL